MRGKSIPPLRCPLFLGSTPLSASSRARPSTTNPPFRCKIASSRAPSFSRPHPSIRRPPRVANPCEYPQPPPLHRLALIHNAFNGSDVRRSMRSPEATRSTRSAFSQGDELRLGWVAGPFGGCSLAGPFGGCSLAGPFGGCSLA